MAPPMTYEVDGKQYVSVLVGYGAGGGETDVLGNMGWKYGLHQRRLLTFALNGSTSLPSTAPPQYKVDLLDDPSLKLDATRVKAGGIVFDQFCAGCHGGGVVANGGAPDLRASPVALSRESFSAVLNKGLLVSQGMPKFDDLSEQEVSSLYEFIRSRAREDLGAAVKH
jgi:quinohemoprotein ethanol dehydrogenase